MQDKIDTIFIIYKDRFIRFGYDWFERLCKMHNTEIVVLNNIETSPTQEMIDDMISIVHVFSCRLYGLRKYKSKLKNGCLNNYILIIHIIYSLQLLYPF